MDIFVLRRLCFDTKSLLEHKRYPLDGMDCNGFQNAKCDGTVSRLMIAHLRQVSGDHYVLGSELTDSSSVPPTDLPRAQYHLDRSELDPYPESSYLHMKDKYEHSKTTTAIYKAHLVADNNGFTRDIYK